MKMDVIYLEKGARKKWMMMDLKNGQKVYTFFTNFPFVEHCDMWLVL